MESTCEFLLYRESKGEKNMMQQGKQLLKDGVMLMI